MVWQSWSLAGVVWHKTLGFNQALSIHTCLKHLHLPRLPILLWLYQRRDGTLIIREALYISLVSITFAYFSLIPYLSTHHSCIQPRLLAYSALWFLSWFCLTFFSLLAHGLQREQIKAVTISHLNTAVVEQMLMAHGEALCVRISIDEYRQFAKDIKEDLEKMMYSLPCCLWNKILVPAWGSVSFLMAENHHVYKLSVLDIWICIFLRRIYFIYGNLITWQ